MAVSIRKPVLLGKLLHESSGNAGILSVDSTKYDDKIIEALDASVNLAIDGASSSASIKLAPGSNVNGRAYIEMFTIQGSAGVFRTRSPRIGYGNGNTQIQLEHAINQLGDFIITETYEKELTLEAAVKQIFKYYDAKGSSYWTYGGFDKPSDPDGVDEYNQKCVLSIDHDNCLDALQSVMEQYPYMYMKFDFGSFPWKVSFRNRPQLAEAQGRLSRNVKSATVTRDDTDLTTRAYGEYKNGKTYTYNAGKFYRDKYGIVEREISGDNDSDKALEQKVKTWVKRHKKPAYSVSIDGIELSNITGEKLDKLTVGKLMTLALPDYNTIITEQITGVSFPSVYKQPMSCTVTLNQEEEKVIKYIKKAQQSARRAGRSASRVQTAAIIGAAVADNVLTLTKGDGTSVNFSKAVSLTKAWGSGTFTVKANQTNKNTSTGKNETKTVATATTKLYGIELQKGKSPSKSGTYNLYLPLKVTYSTGDPKSPKADTGFTSGITVSAKTVWDSVTIKSIGLASNYSPLGDSAGDTRYMVYIEAKASNGAKKDDKLLTLASTKYAGNSKYCVNLKDGSDIIGRINIDSVYTAGWNAVTISSIGLASNYSALGNNDTRTNIYFQAVASNGAKKDDKLITLASTTYGGGYCVNVKDGSDVIGRIDIDSVYTAGWNAVTISSIGLASNYSALGNNDTRTNIYIQAVASNGAKKDDKLITLASTTYGGGYCVNLKDGNSVIGRIDIDSVYNAGRDNLDGDWIDLNGSSASTSTSKPTTALNRSDPAKITGYIWLQKSDSKWKNLRSFSITTNATHLTVPLYYLSGGNYIKCTKSKLYYYTE